MRFHDLRHSAATLLLAMGVHIKVVQELLGHSNIPTTLNIYSHCTSIVASRRDGHTSGLFHYERREAAASQDDPGDSCRGCASRVPTLVCSSSLSY